ncbi:MULTISPECIES: aminoglycoside phosphotransferase family protein [unclassified Mycobacterium]|uniref:aminoglycoside phosphotransferase family protein n=1 Tax=unclassified Mycobacterium TaxID=2642494 RepID=UPI0029C93712|nr:MULTISPECIES: aminoglycoside phosphotransferase family protein [unclassified Mycobacterium]
MTELDDLVAEWELRPDGTAIQTSHATVLPVRADGIAAVLKISTSDAESEHAHLVLRRWGGDGAVRLLRADPHRRAVLLERLRPETLETLWDIDACEVVAGLYRRLHVAAMPQLRSLTSCLEQWADDFATLPRSAPIPHRLVEQAITLCRELATEPADRVLHGNLHYGNVLTGDREPWLVIAPTPLNGDPHYELAPMLWSRWDELAGDVRGGVQRRFYTLVDAAGFDEDRARGWTIVRVAREASRALSRGGDPSTLTRFVTLAKAVQD